jgi:hypothetical protein
MPFTTFEEVGSLLTWKYVSANAHRGFAPEGDGEQALRS